MPQLTQTQAQEEVPLGCTPKLISAFCDELSVDDSVSIDRGFAEKLAFFAAEYQRNRIKQHLELTLTTRQQYLGSILAAKQAGSKEDNRRSEPKIGALQGYLEGRLEAEIELLQSLIAALR